MSRKWCHVCGGELGTQAARAVGVCSWCILASVEAERTAEKVFPTPKYSFQKEDESG